MTDIAMSAFAMFFMQAESFLEFQRKVEQRYHRSNLSTLFGVSAIPTDPHIRTVADKVPPESLQPAFDHAFGVLRDNKGLKAFTRLGGRLLVALDGTEYFSSQKLSCENCLSRKRRNGEVEHYHSMLCATVVAPGERHVLHLMPEFIETPDGNDKQDCERNAAKRWLRSSKTSVLEGQRPVFLGDALFSCQSVTQAVKGIEGADFIFAVKPDSHETLFEAFEHAEVTEVTKPGAKNSTHTYRFAKGLPIRRQDPVLVDFCEIVITNHVGKVTYRNTFVTSIEVTKDTVIEIVACGRTRWKIENESFNVLKNHGYNLARNFGHGKQHLAKTFAAMNLLAFCFHNVCDLIDELWQQARQRAGKRTSFFERLAITCDFHVFTNWTELMTSLITRNLPVRE